MAPVNHLAHLIQWVGHGIYLPRYLPTYLIVSAIYCFCFQEMMHAKMQVFLNQPWRQMRASLILLFGKTKALFGKDTTKKKTAFLHTLLVENERETSKRK